MRAAGARDSHSTARSATALVVALVGAACASEAPAGPGSALVLQLGHSRPVQAMEFTRDGERLLTLGMDGTVRLWDLRAAREVGRLTSPGGAESIERLGQLADGRVVATCAGSTLIWEPSSGAQEERPGWARASAGGRHLVELALERPGLEVTSAASGDALAWLPREGQALVGVAFSPDDRYALVEFADRVQDGWFDSDDSRHRARLLDVERARVAPWFTRFDADAADLVGDAVDALTGMPAFRRASGWSATFAPDGEQLVLASQEVLPQLRSTGDGARRAWFDEWRAPGMEVAFSRDGEHVLVYDGWQFELRDRDDGELAWTAPNPFASWPTLALSPGGRYLLATSERQESSGFLGLGRTTVREVHLWDVEADAELDWAGRYTLSADTARMSPDDRLLVRSEGQVAVLHELADGAELARLGSAVLAADLVALSPDGRWVFVDGAGVRRVWDLERGHEVVRWTGDAALGEAAFDPTGRYLVLAEAGRGFDAARGAVRVLEVPGFRPADPPPGLDPVRLLDGRTEAPPVPLDVVVVEPWSDPDEPFDVFAGSYELVDPATGARFGPFPFEPDSILRAPLLSEDGGYTLVRRQEGPVLVDLRAGADVPLHAAGDPTRELRLVAADGSQRWVLFPGRHWMATFREEGGARRGEVRGLPLEDAADWAGYGDLVDESTLTISADGRFLCVAQGAEVVLWDVREPDLPRRLTGHLDTVLGVAFEPGSRWLASVSLDRTVRLWSTERAAPLAVLASLEADGWLVADPEGRFDTSDLDDSSGMGWVLPDDPLRALPVELFLQEYFEPELLPKLLAGEPLPALRDLADLNRALPVVRLGEPRPAPDGAAVELDVRVVEGAYRRAGDGGPEQRSGAHGLRVFRDGVLIAERPDPEGFYDARDRGPWRAATRIELDGDEPARTFPVRVPLPADGERFELSAYAFNRDGVKGPTAFRSFVRRGPAPRRAPRAVLVSVGVDRIEGAGLAWSNLSYATEDARRLQAWLTDWVTAGADEVAVEPHLLVSERGADAAAPTATKDGLRRLLRALAGNAGERAPDVRPTGPDDLVVVTFSGHGWVAPTGEFYLFPYDTGPRLDARPRPEQLARLVSATELSTWMRGIDARRVVLVLDACHAAGAVEAPGFKPGPYSSRGLGQLAYDKQALILVATQSEDVAYGSGELGHSLLTEAVLRAGDRARRWAELDPADLAPLVARAATELPMMPVVTAPGPDAGAADAAPALDPFDLAPVLAAAAAAVPALHAEFVDGAPDARVQEPVLLDFGALRSRRIAPPEPGRRGAPRTKREEP